MNNRKPGRDFSGDRKKTSFNKDKGGFKRREDSSDKPRRNFSKGGDERKFDKPRRSFSKDSSDKPRRSFDKEKSYGEDRFKRNADGGEKKRYPEKNFNRSSKSFSKDRSERSFDKPRRNFSDDKDRYSEKGSDKPRRNFLKDGEERSFDKPRRNYDGGDREKKSDFKKDNYAKRNERKERYYKKDYSKKKETKPTFAEQGLTRLNKFIANAGICSRREADDLIKSGCVTVNGKVITELGFKVREGDVVNYSGENLKTEKHVYLLLNKPKDYITTAEDERGRRTVMELLEGACKERIYPVGRLDRNTTGLLLFTNDGELTKKLTHPKHEVKKLYHVELDKNLKQTDLLKIREGLELEDGFIKPDEISYAGETKRELGIEIHSGKNRIVRRIFEHLDYEVVKLDRVMFAGLTKKNLPKGRWRMLEPKEVSFLKMV
ncbi:MAG: pseudouridine synthase [Bacteroidia bacterium]